MKVVGVGQRDWVVGKVYRRGCLTYVEVAGAGIVSMADAEVDGSVGVAASPLVIRGLQMIDLRGIWRDGRRKRGCC